MKIAASSYILLALSCFGGSVQPVFAKAFSISGAMEVSSEVPDRKFNPDESVAPISTRQDVSFSSTLPVGSIVVKTKLRKLYFISGTGRAVEYAVSVGREGFAWSGTNTIARKAEWPDWRPPPNMIEREATRGHLIPDFVKGGPGNPLGARALYLGKTEFRIHGTDKPGTVGFASSSGCIRMLNADVIELYARAKIGATVVVE